MSALSDVEIGPIPNGWLVKPIRELCQITSGGTPRKTEAAFWSGDIPWVSGKDLKSPQLDDSIDHISVEGLEAGSRLAPARLILGHPQVRNLGLAIDHGRHHAPCRVLHQFSSIRHSAPLTRTAWDKQILCGTGSEPALSDVAPASCRLSGGHPAAPLLSSAGSHPACTVFFAFRPCPF